MASLTLGLCLISTSAMATANASSPFPGTIVYVRFGNNRTFCKPFAASRTGCLAATATTRDAKTSAQLRSLRALEWDKLCDSVASFAGTSLGREATKAQLWSVNQTYEESMRLLAETNAAVQMHRHGGFSLDFSSVNAALVKSAIRQARRDLPVRGHEAIAVASLLLFIESLQLSLRAAIKEDEDWHRRLMPLSELILQVVINRGLIKSIQQVIDEDGSVKDSASPLLKRSREQVLMIEKKLLELMDKLVRNEINGSSFLEVSVVDGRCCIKSTVDKLTNVKGLLLSSGSANGIIVEPLAAVPLNDELQQARASVAKAEEDVLLMLTKKMQVDLDETEMLLNSTIQLDVINARAAYGLSCGSTCPDLLLLEDMNEVLDTETSLLEHKISKPSKSIAWTLFLPKTYHPLLLQQHRLSLVKARKDVSQAAAEIGRRKMQAGISKKQESDIDLAVLKERVTSLEQAHPVAVDFFISRETKALVITGPNTGGKTVCLKTVGLAALMAKSGLHVVSTESAKIPWFDAVFADIGDEQSLTQSLSTFSGHLKQISDILSESTTWSLVLLDEVGAGTNPLEGAALGMSLLESFASRALLTIATTHHGELKTLKYSNNGFENACMEFDEVNLKPTYKILWGIPGRSNAINIAERLGLPGIIVDESRKLYGEASAEINELITDMERFKQEFHELHHDSQQYLMLARDLHEKLLVSRRRIEEHRINQKNKMVQEILNAAAVARSLLHKKVRQLRASQVQRFEPIGVNKCQNLSGDYRQHYTEEESENLVERKSSTLSTAPMQKSSDKKNELPAVGDMVHVPSLGRKATVLKADYSKGEILVQAGNMKLKLKLRDLQN